MNLPQSVITAISTNLMIIEDNGDDIVIRYNYRMTPKEALEDVEDYYSNMYCYEYVDPYLEPLIIENFLKRPILDAKLTIYEAVSDLSLLNQFQKNVESRGCCISEIEAHQGSMYIEISRDNNIMFRFRVSDHDLTTSNQLPAGVINCRTEFLELLIKDGIDYWLDEYNNMNDKEKGVLWTNRFLDVDENGDLIILN